MIDKIAKFYMEMFQNEQGVYLVRRTLRNENILVLSMMWNGEFFNYEICVREENPEFKLFYIDDGPYFRTLAHLIEHYSKYEDGLPCVLKRSIEPGFSVHNTIGQPNLNSTQIQIKTSRQNISNSSNNSLRNEMNHLNANNGCGGINQLQQLIKLDSFDQMNDQMQFGHTRTDAMAKVNLFKSRTLLNDQSILIKFRLVVLIEIQDLFYKFKERRSASQLSKKLAKILPNEVHLQAIIGEGEFGTVYKGTYNGVGLNFLNIQILNINDPQCFKHFILIYLRIYNIRFKFINHIILILKETSGG